MSPQLLFAIWLTGWRAIIANLFFWPLSAVLFVVLVWCIVRWYRWREKTWQREPQPKDEPSGLEAFDAEQMELYQTGLWLLQHRETTPYDDL
jgi:hypothetical protein